MLSRYVPENFDAHRPVAVIAGKFRYPMIMVETLRARGVPVRLIAFEGETELELFESFPESERAMIKVGQVGKMLSALKRMGAAYAVMAGQVTPGRLFNGLHPDLKAITMLALLKERNAESIFGALAKEIEKIGVCQLDARAFMDEHMAHAGNMTSTRLDVDDESIGFGVRIAKHIAQVDIGQGVVVSRGTVLAVEAFEGTDAMIRRAGTLGAKEMVFVKTVKPRQDYRFDVPVFGLKTLDTLREAGVRTAALEAGSVLMLDKARVILEAKRTGIGLYGYAIEAGK